MDDSRHSSPYAVQDAGSYDGDNEMPSQDSETDIASSPNMDHHTDSYDGDTEMLSEGSQTETASEGSKASLNNEMPSQDTKTDTASPDSEACLDNETKEPSSPCSSKEMPEIKASVFFKNKNEEHSENDLIENDDHVSKRTADCDLADENIESSNDNEEVISTESSKILICDVCYKKFSDREQLWIHKSIQSPPITYYCEECLSSFHIECAFEYHKSFVHTPHLFSTEEEK